MQFGTAPRFEMFVYVDDVDGTSRETPSSRNGHSPAARRHALGRACRLRVRSRRESGGGGSSCDVIGVAARCLAGALPI